MKLTFIDSLQDSSQRGGAYLRIKAIKEVYESLGLDLDVHYSSEFNTETTISTLLKSFYYGKCARILFKKCSHSLAQSDFIHFDNIRHFNWNFSPNKGRIIYNAHNLEFENYFDRNSKDSKKNRFINYELDKIESSYLTFVCSKREKRTLVGLRSKLREKVFVLPNLVDSSNYSSSQEKKVISFIGTLDYFPNTQAINYLCKVFMPEISDTIKKEFEFVIAGRSPMEGQREMCEQAGFSFRTDLSGKEISKLFADTAVCLVPLEHGSGTRLKIIESIFSGAVVLSTGLGREGIKSEGIVEASLGHFPEALSKIIDSKKVITTEVMEEFKKGFDTKTWIRLNNSYLKEALKI